METKVFTVEGMSCEHCVRAVTAALKGVPGVADVKVDLAGKQATVTYDPARAKPEALQKAVAEEGYTLHLPGR